MNKQMIILICNQLVGINESELTTAEKNIFRILSQNKMMYIDNQGVLQIQGNV